MLEQNIGFKCDESYLEDSALRLIKKSLRQKECNCPHYKFIFLDLQDPTIIMTRFVKNLN